MRVYHILMNKYSLTLRMLTTNGSFLSSIRRIQSGFLPERNIKEARELLNEFKLTLDQIEKSLHEPPQPHDPNYMPLK